MSQNSRSSNFDLARLTRKMGGVEGFVERVKKDEFEALNSDLIRVPGTENSPTGPRSLKRAIILSGVEKLGPKKRVEFDDRGDVEAIIRPLLRPVFAIINGDFGTVSNVGYWKFLNGQNQRKIIRKTFSSVGRVEVKGIPRLPFAGTCFVVGKGLVMTNRHVAEIFSTQSGPAKYKITQGLEVSINFRREEGKLSAGKNFKVSKVVMIHPYWDMAVLKVEGLEQAQVPLQLSTRDLRESPDTDVFVVGYPAEDDRNPEGIQDKMFNGKFRIKRFQPGDTEGAVIAGSFGKEVSVVGHDCTTLGGNSGSPVFEMSSGEVMSLHFGGRYEKINYAVPLSELARDSRVIDAGVKFLKPIPPARPQYAAYWTLTENGLPNEKVFVTRAKKKNNSVESFVEPKRNKKYSSRKGYQSDFLAVKKESGIPLNVAMPKAKRAAEIAKTIDGTKVLNYQNFSVAMHAKRRLALITAANVTAELKLKQPDPAKAYSRAALSGLAENDREQWFFDPRMDEKFQVPDQYFNNDQGAFDKGHLVRREDIAWGKTYAQLLRANGDSYHLTNCTPQVLGFNRSSRGVDNWGDLENAVFSQSDTERLIVFSGPILRSDDPFVVGKIAKGQPLNLQVPTTFWKVIVCSVPEGIASFGFMMDQDLSLIHTEFVVPNSFVPMLAPIDQIGLEASVVFPANVLKSDRFNSGGAESMGAIGVYPRKKS
jgi:endonuclease G, mitochondrial